MSKKEQNINSEESAENQVIENEQETAQQPETEQQEQTEEEKLKAQVEELSAKVADLEDKNLRMMAEFQNLRTRTNREKLELRETAGARIFTDLLVVVDDFERAQQAMAASEDIQAIRDGQDLIYQKFIKFLADNGVKAIETENADFDTDLHEAIATFPAGDPEKVNKVIDCTKKGYLMGEKVIRHAQVVVGA